MTLKRSRQEMMSVVKKSVRFAILVEHEPCSSPATTAPNSSCKEECWYDRHELMSQLDQSNESLELAMKEGFGVLLQNSYEHPHVNVQEYLNAYAAYSKDQDTLRGLEQRLSLSHRDERLHVRAAHLHKVLQAQQEGQQPSSWEALAKVSRQSSAASKLFAMRMGRADARANNSTDPDLAKEIVWDHLLREQYRNKQRQRSNALNLTRTVEPPSSTGPATPLLSPSLPTPKIMA